MTVEEYLEFECSSPIKHEHVGGEVFAMGGSSKRHAELMLNLAIALRASVDGGPCRVFVADVHLRVDHDRYYYPDVVVTRDPADDDPDIVRMPCLVAEVLSPSTERTDRGEKAQAYRGMPSLETYLIIDQDRRHIIRFWRDDGRQWQQEHIIGAGKIPVPCLNTTISLDAIYRGITLED
jgi:Uma2 family endonuclease